MPRHCWDELGDLHAELVVQAAQQRARRTARARSAGGPRRQRRLLRYRRRRRARRRAADPGAARRPWPGTLQLDIDLSDLERRVFQVRETIPVAPGALVLQYPRWLPGNHAPTGSPELLAGLVIEGLGAAPAPGAQAARRRIEWRRDELDMYSFRLEVPAGVRTLELRFQFVTPVSSDQGRRTVTPDLLGLQWEKALLYPAGHYVRRILVQPSIRLPAGFEFASALEGRNAMATWCASRPCRSRRWSTRRCSRAAITAASSSPPGPRRRRGSTCSPTGPRSSRRSPRRSRPTGGWYARRARCSARVTTGTTTSCSR
ncbi:MAG: hypothetical protein U1F11_01840 [Steroidobacteraceae bacterium]